MEKRVGIRKEDRDPKVIGVREEKINGRTWTITTLKSQTRGRGNERAGIAPDRLKPPRRRKTVR